MGPSSSSTACNSSSRDADSANPSAPKIWEPMWPCSPRNSSVGWARIAATASAASARAMPNFWSSRAVARYSWVCACTPVLTRSRTGCTSPWCSRRGGDPLDLDQAVEHDDADAHLHGTVDLGHRLVVAVEAESLRRDSGGERDGELSPAAHVDAESGVGDPPRHLGAEERLARVVHLGRGADAGELAVEALAGVLGAGADIRFVHHIERSAELCGEFLRVDAGELQASGCAAQRVRRPHRLGQVVGVPRMLQPGWGERTGSQGKPHSVLGVLSGA